MSYDETMSAIDEALDDSWEWRRDAARWHPGLEHDERDDDLWAGWQQIGYTTDGETLRAEWTEPMADYTAYQQIIEESVRRMAQAYGVRLDLLLAPPARMPEVFIPAPQPMSAGREPDVVIFDETHHWTEANPAWESIVEEIRQRAVPTGSWCITGTTAR